MDLVVDFEGCEEKVWVEKLGMLEYEVYVGDCVYCVDVLIDGEVWSFLFDG